MRRRSRGTAAITFKFSSVLSEQPLMPMLHVQHEHVGRQRPAQQGSGTAGCVASRVRQACLEILCFYEPAGHVCTGLCVPPVPACRRPAAVLCPLSSVSVRLLAPLPSFL